MHMLHMPTHQRTCTLIAFWDHQNPFQTFHNDTFRYCYICLYKLLTQHHFIQHLHYMMNATEYWLLAREYSMWNATVAALQFWTAYFEPHILSSTIEQVYTAFLYTTSTHLLCQQSKEVLFGHFVTTINTAFESKLTLEDEGYESGSDNFNICTPLRWTSRIHHVSSDKNISFDPFTPCTTATSQSHHKPVCHQLSFSGSDDKESSAVHLPSNYSTAPPQNPMGFAQQPPYNFTYITHDDL